MGKSLEGKEKAVYLHSQNRNTVTHEQTERRKFRS